MAKQSKYNLGTAWFLAVIVISVIASVTTFNQNTIYLVLAVAGASIAIINVKIVEETNYLIAVSAFLIIALSFIMLDVVMGNLELLLRNLSVAFGTTGFIIAIAQIAKLDLTK